MEPVRVRGYSEIVGEAEKQPYSSDWYGVEMKSRARVIAGQKVDSGNVDESQRGLVEERRYTGEIET